MTRVVLCCVLMLTLPGCWGIDSTVSLQVDRPGDEGLTEVCDVLRLVVASQVVDAAIWGELPDVVSVAPTGLEDGAGLSSAFLSRNALSERLDYDISEELAASFASAVRLRPGLDEECLGGSLDAGLGVVVVRLVSHADVMWRADGGGGLYTAVSGVGLDREAGRALVFVRSQRAGMPFSEVRLILLELEETSPSAWTIVASVDVENVPCMDAAGM